MGFATVKFQLEGVKMVKKSMAKTKEGKRLKVLAKTEKAIKNAPIIETKEQLMTVANLATPVHLLVSGFQAEAVLTMVELMRESSNDAVRLKASGEILALGGNSSEMLKIQAVMSGRHKDLSQMTNAELDAFIAEAKRNQDIAREIAAHNAEDITPMVEAEAIEQPPTVEEPTPWDALGGADNLDGGL